MASDAEKMPALASRRANACLAPQRVLQFWCVVVACTLAAGSLGKTTGSGTAQGGGAARVVRGPGAGPTREVLVDSHRPHQDSAVAAAAVSAAPKRNPESRFSRQVRVWVDRLVALRWLGGLACPVRAEAHGPRGPCSATERHGSKPHAQRATANGGCCAWGLPSARCRQGTAHRRRPLRQRSKDALASPETCARSRTALRTARRRSPSTTAQLL